MMVRKHLPVPRPVGKSAPRKRRTRPLRIWPRRSLRRRWWRRFRRLPRAERLLLALTAAALLALAANALYQIVHKPSELFFPVSGALNKPASETWRDYGALFERYSTATITPQLLAALAQVEAAGNPLARTYWRWSWSLRPLELYRPASSAVGMYQITDGTFAEARHYCIHDHTLAREGRWSDWHACWFNLLYLRILPGDAVELTAAYLDLKVNAILARLPLRSATRLEKQHLGALVHLCGEAAATGYARAGFRLSAAERCGDHDPRVYLEQVDSHASLFARLEAAER